MNNVWNKIKSPYKSFYREIGPAVIVFLQGQEHGGHPQEEC